MSVDEDDLRPSDQVIPSNENDDSVAEDTAVNVAGDDAAEEGNDPLAPVSEPETEKPSAAAVGSMTVPPVATTPASTAAKSASAAGEGEGVLQAVVREARAEAPDYKSMFTGRGFSDFLRFRTFAFPVFAPYLYLFFTAMAVARALYLIGCGLFGEQFSGRFVFAGLLYLIVGPVLVRVASEAIYVLFKIHRELMRLNQKK